jgi:hypothetical protein
VAAIGVEGIEEDREIGLWLAAFHYLSTLFCGPW